MSHPKSHSEQGEAQKKEKKKIASLIMPHAISQSEGFAPVLDSSALGYKNWKDRLCITVQRMMVEPIVSAKGEVYSIKKPCHFIMGNAF